MEFSDAFLIKGGDMGSSFNRLHWSCILVLFFFMVSSCSNQMLKKTEGEKEFSQEASRLEKLSHEHPEASVRARSHLQIAFLYVNYRNPQLNYSRALREIESYLSLTPAKAQTDDVQNWLAVLQKIESLQMSLKRVQEANKSLREEVSGLREVNNKMRETIETLNSLDRQMEEKRNLSK
jgi:chromosome segregation ATPase